MGKDRENSQVFEVHFGGRVFIGDKLNRVHGKNLESTS